MPRYSQGDRVIVRPDLKKDTRYFMDDGGINLGVADEMLRFAGVDVTIKFAKNTDFYKIEESGFGWTDEMFLGLADEVNEQPDFEPSDMSIEELLRS